jgi:hypothetical protein
VDSAPVKDGLTSPANAEDTRTANTKDVPTSRASEPPKAVPKDRHPPGYMREYVAKWRKGEVGKKHKK